MIARIFRWFLLLVFLAFMLLPLYASLRFSVGPTFTLAHYQTVLNDYLLWRSLRYSLTIASGVIILSLVLIVLAAYWTSTRWPEARPYLNTLALLPFVIPGVILVLGLIRVYSHSPIPITNTPYMLVLATTVLTLPYMYRAIDNAFRAIDVRTLTEAAASLGASPIVTLWRVILPNVFPGILSGSLLAVSGILGEFVVANLLVGQSYMTFPVYVRWKGFTTARLGTSLAVLSFLLTVILAMAIITVTRKWSQAGEQSVTKAV
jgi:putative spermidine/putrescine transport system permease protein